MPRKVIVIDTSMLCVWLKVPRKESCGHDGDRWDFDRVHDCIRGHEAECAQFVMPLATVIEVGNHIAGCDGDRYALAQCFAGHLRKAVQGVTPWVTFTDQSSLWDAPALEKLVETWPDQAKCRLSLADASIVAVADYYHRAGSHVVIFTGDRGLKSYEPPPRPDAPAPPRRRSRG